MSVRAGAVFRCVCQPKKNRSEFMRSTNGEGKRTRAQLDTPEKEVLLGKAVGVPRSEFLVGEDRVRLNYRQCSLKSPEKTNTETETTQSFVEVFGPVEDRLMSIGAAVTPSSAGAPRWFLVRV